MQNKIAKKTWSITTTLRNPDRLRSFLSVLKNLEGEIWDNTTQVKYQILLIKERVYGYGSMQFYTGLTKKQIKIIDNSPNDISYREAENILETKQYEDPPHRGRESLNPLTKFGFALIDENKKIIITGLGKSFLRDDFDLGDIFLKSFIKWQIPNPSSRDYKKQDGYDIKPFIGTLQLINKVNMLSSNIGEKTKGISKREFSLFCPTLVNYKNINKHAQMIIDLRLKMKGEEQQRQNEIFDDFANKFARKFHNLSNSESAEKKLKNLKDYGDNAIRYFRLTNFIYVRGGGFYIDLEPRRKTEIENLLSSDNAKSRNFENKKEYLNFIANISEPELPWETKPSLLKIISDIIDDIEIHEKELGIANKKIIVNTELNINELKSYASELRVQRKLLQSRKAKEATQNVEQINCRIENLRGIHSCENRPVLLEKLVTQGLNALNDAQTIQPNYPVGDDGEPTYTAPGNTPDIECYYETFNAICEVTMLRNRTQWYNEGQPVMRHLRDFESNSQNKICYCVFIAPSLHRDTINTYMTSVKHGYEGPVQKIVPLTINNFIALLEILIDLKNEHIFLKHKDIICLYDKIINNSASSKTPDEWTSQTHDTIISWGETLK